MNNPEEGALRDLHRFVISVLNGCLDNESSAHGLIRYEFQQRTIKDVVRRGSEDADLVPQIHDELHHLLIYLNEEIVDTAAKASAAGMDNRHFIELNKRLQLMHEVRKAMNVHESYQAKELMDHVHACCEAVKHAYDQCKDFHSWDELSVELREFFLGLKPEEKNVIEAAEPTLFARDDGVVSSIAHEKAQSEDEGKKSQFVSQTAKVLNNYRAKNPDYKTMRELINANVKFRLEGIYCDNIINEFISVWDIAIDYKVDKLHERYAFTALLRKVFLMMSDQRRNDFACKLFNKYKEENDILPCLDNFIENFQNVHNEALNKLPLDLNALSNNLELFEKMKDMIVWFLFVSPTYTVQQLLTMCVDNKGYHSIVSKILRFFPTLFERSVCITPVGSETGKKNKLLITLLHRIFKIGRTSWTSASNWDNAGSLSMCLVKERKRKEGQAIRIEDKALLDPYSLLEFTMMEILEGRREPQKSVETLVKMLQRLLANNNNTRLYTNYSFGTCYRAEGEKVLPTPEIVELMFELLMAYDGKSIEICDNAREVLKSIGGRMAADKICFDEYTCKFLTDNKFNVAPWWIKYSIHSWFSVSLRNPRKQVPSGIYKTISDESVDEFEQIKSEEKYAVSECYMRSIFELGLFDVDLALELLKFSYGIKFEETTEKMALALVDSYGKRMSKRSGGVHVGKLIKEMLNTFDPVRNLVPTPSYNACLLRSVPKVEHIVVLSTAARIAREKQWSAERIKRDKRYSNDDTVTAKELAEQLMDIFCETAKSHIENEVNEVEKFRIEANKIIFSTPGRSREQINAMLETADREQSLIIQLPLIYVHCTNFCRLYSEIPIKLKQLMNSTLEKQFDVQKLSAKRSMDDVLTDERKAEAAYVFTDLSKIDQQKDLIQPAHDADSYNSKQTQSRHGGNSSTDNAMVDNEEYHQRRRSNQNSRAGHRRYENEMSYENEGPSSSRGFSGRNEHSNSYRGSRYQPVNDTHSFNQRDRNHIYNNCKNSNNDYDRIPSRKDHSKQNNYDTEILFYNDKRTPFKLRSEMKSDDVRRCSESKDYNQDNSWDGPSPSRRWLSESEHAQDDSENRYLEQTVRSVHSFSCREQQNASKQSTSTPKGQERKQQKKGFGESNKFQGNNRRPTERKQGYTSSNYIENEDEKANRLKPGQPQREELANALGFKSSQR